MVCTVVRGRHDLDFDSRNDDFDGLWKIEVTKCVCTVRMKLRTAADSSYDHMSH
jgi:hypothetical protein